MERTRTLSRQLGGLIESVRRTVRDERSPSDRGADDGQESTGGATHGTDPPGSGRDVRRREFLRGTGAIAGSAGLGVAAAGEVTANPEAEAIGELCAGNRTDDTDLPWSTGGDYGGWGGHEYHGTEPGIERPPSVFVHGNTADACTFDDHATSLLDWGWAGDELWAITFAESTPTHEAMAEQLDAFVDGVLDETGVNAVNLVPYSLGVTGTRYWLQETDRYDDVDTFVGIAGANHGLCACPCCCDATVGGDFSQPCEFLAVQCFAYPGHPLSELNEPTETPGDVDYYTIRGLYDPLYACNPYSPALVGATNRSVPAEHVGALTAASTKYRLRHWL